MEHKYISRSIDDTIRLAENIESEKFSNMIICLNGDLGCGKTVFTKGFANALGIKDTITSPTFTLIKEYDSGEMPFFHMDVYRLDEKAEEFDVREYYNKDGVVLIEWAELLEKNLPEERLDINFIVNDENIRTITLKPYGKQYEEICELVL